MNINKALETIGIATVAYILVSAFGSLYTYTYQTILFIEKPPRGCCPRPSVPGGAKTSLPPSDFDVKEAELNK